MVLFGLWTGRLWPGPSCRPTILVPCSELQLSLEEPVETAILLSLVGVGSIVASQWPTVLQDNAMRARVLWESEWFRSCCAVLQPRSLPGPGGRMAHLRADSSLDLLAVGRPIGRTTRLLQEAGASEAAHHGN